MPSNAGDPIWERAISDSACDRLGLERISPSRGKPTAYFEEYAFLPRDGLSKAPAAQAKMADDLLAALWDVQRPRKLPRDWDGTLWDVSPPRKPAQTGMNGTDDADWVFRGHADATWKLSPHSRRPQAAFDGKAMPRNQRSQEPLHELVDWIFEHDNAPLKRDQDPALGTHFRAALEKLILRFHAPLDRYLAAQRVSNRLQEEFRSYSDRWHRMRCEAEFESVRQFAIAANDAGLALLDPIDSIPDGQAAVSQEVVLWHPSRTTALAQHHEIPTKLLDWSRRIKVAAYFAAMRLPNGREDAMTDRLAIWALDARVLKCRDTGDARDQPIVRALFAPHAGHGFLHAQDGLFTWIDEDFQRCFLHEHLRWADLKDALGAEGLSNRPVLVKVTCPRSVAPALRRRLKLDRISMATMMPSYNHAARSVMSDWRDLEYREAGPR
jgi:hypothetical protein